MMQRMMSMHEQMMKKMEEMSAQLDQKMTAMNAATGEQAQIDAIWGIINELVSQRKEMMNKMMAGMKGKMGKMMGGMSGEETGPGMKMMKKMKSQGGEKNMIVIIQE